MPPAWLELMKSWWLLDGFGWTEICAKRGWSPTWYTVVHCSSLVLTKKRLSNENIRMHFRKRLQNCPTRRMALKSSGWPTPPPPFKNQLLCLGWVPFGTQKLAASNAKNHSFLPSKSGKISRKHTILIGYKWLMLRGFPLQIGRFFWAQKWAQQIRWKPWGSACKWWPRQKSMNITTLSPIIHDSVENGIVIEKVRILIEDTLNFSRNNTMLMGGRVDGSCDRNHWKMPPKSMLKKHKISRCKPEARRSHDVFIFFENDPMCQMKCSQFDQQTSQHQGSRSYHPAKSSQKLPGQLEKPR